ncbi:ABC transporter substrate-binding protein [Pontibacter silvestris]|uniref:ABC transporter substrate-binding protein n=1 Tax=Pontibacter silvestris TaxID=2305183 RepID=A0ABW4X3F1_9BACT|nr:helical backbone metal receptor [Pontibacter silvestris]MCC9138280.1 helical backbone metal receptor [Pontibacter silvestris]
MKQKLHLFDKLCWLLLLSLLLSSACSQTEKPTEEGTIVLQDDLGREIQLEKQPLRVVSLASSMTEMLFAVLDTSTIVGRTQNDDYPAAALTKPVVKNYPIDYEQVLRLKPDVIFTVEGITPPDDAARLEELGVPVYYQTYASVEDIFNGLEDIGRIMGREEQAEHLTDSLRQQVNELKQRYQAQQRQPLRVLAITWKDPIYVHGQNTILTDKLHILGAENAVQEVFDQPYPSITREYILKLNPDVILGDDREKMEKEFFGQYPELRKTKAYQQGRIYGTTDNLMSRPGPRVVESILELERLLYHE